MEPWTLGLGIGWAVTNAVSYLVGRSRAPRAAPPVPYDAARRPALPCTCAECPCALHVYEAGRCAWCKNGAHAPPTPHALSLPLASLDARTCADCGGSDAVVQRLTNPGRPDERRRFLCKECARATPSP